MKWQKLLLAAVAVGVVFNAYDFVVHGMLLVGYYETLPVMNQSGSMFWLILGDFLAALVFLWVYDRVYDSFGGGIGGGMKFGMYAGVLVNFPTWLFLTVIIAGYPYALGWIMVAVGIVAAIIGGAVAGALYKKETKVY